MKTAFGWVSNLGILYREGRAPMVATLIVMMLLALSMASTAFAKGPVVSGTEDQNLLVSWLLTLFGARNLS